MRCLLLLLTALVFAGAQPVRAGAPVLLASGKYVRVLGDPGAERLAAYTASLIDEVTPGAARLVGTSDLRPVTVILYRDHRQFAADVGPRYASAAGVTSYPSGVIRLDVSQADVAEIRHVIPHETAHVMVGRAVGASYPGLATWFNEGVAELAAGKYAVLADPALVAGFTTERAIPLAALDRVLNEQDTIHYSISDAYAEALSLVRFLTSRYGDGVVAKLLAATREEGRFEPALKEVTGLDLAQVETEWRASLRSGPSWVDSLDVNLLVWAVMVLLLLAAVVRYQLAKRRRDADDESREEEWGDEMGAE